MEAWSREADAGEEVGPQDGLVYVNLEGPLADAIGLDLGAVRCDEVHSGGAGQVRARGWYDSD